MSALKKSLIKIPGIIAGAAGAYIGLGGVLYYGVLGRPTLNRKPENQLDDPGKMRRYVRDEYYREADDWYEANTPAEQLLVNSKGETLHAEVIRQPGESRLWAVVNHGYSSRPQSMACQAIHYFKRGYNVLLPYMRGHRNSEQKTSSMGYYERYDIVSWINYIVSTDPEAQIVIHGCSMGAATTMLTLGEKLPENVKCAVADCGFTDCLSQFREQITNITHLPPFPFLNMANAFSKIFMGWKFEDCAPVKAVAKTSIPLLFIHGENDDFVPYSMMDTLYNACASEKEKLSVAGAGHDQSCEVNPELYWKTTDAFTDRYIK